MLDAYKELTPVVYGESGINFQEFDIEAGEMCFTAHWHDRIELLLILSGSLEVYLNKEHVTVLPGQTVIIAPQMIHCGYSGAGGVHYQMIAFDVERFCNSTAASDKYLTPICRNTANFRTVADHPDIASAFTDLADYFNMEGRISPLFAMGKVYELIALFYRHCSAGPDQISKTDKRFGRVLEYINSHYTENISARSISRKFGYDETYFCRCFKATTGIPTMKYIRILRLEKAQSMLKNDGDEIREIAWKCGFSDVSYFSNCFKRHFGITPSKYRNTPGLSA